MSGTRTCAHLQWLPTQPAVAVPYPLHSHWLLESHCVSCAGHWRTLACTRRPWLHTADHLHHLCASPPLRCAMLAPPCSPEAPGAADSKDTAVTVAKAETEIDPEQPPKGILAKMQYAVSYGTSVDIHQVVEEDDMVAAIHQNAEVFDPKAEQAFAYLQVGGRAGRGVRGVGTAAAGSGQR